MDNYIKIYREQMEQVTLSDAADRAIGEELLKTDAGKGALYMKQAGSNSGKKEYPMEVHVSKNTGFP